MEYINWKTGATSVGCIDLVSTLGILDVFALSCETARDHDRPRDYIQLILSFAFVICRILAACWLLLATRTKINRNAIQRADIWRCVNAAYFVLMWGALVMTIKPLDGKLYFRWYLSTPWVVLVLLLMLGVFIGVVSAFVNHLEAIERKRKSAEGDGEN
ncbi:unnamed protein product [Orchesella dallaii]|uniref:Transmembrane protein n=1 Tax=Orchesella dallaii TaxID=48710 RepID=A0ABP1RIL1_9HEXA